MEHVAKCIVSSQMATIQMKQLGKFKMVCKRIEYFTSKESYRGASTANIKALRGSLGALSVNKLSHIPKLQQISAVYENQ